MKDGDFRSVYFYSRDIAAVQAEQNDTGDSFSHIVRTAVRYYFSNRGEQTRISTQPRP